MKIVISSGHGKYIRGASGYLDEVDEARRVVEEVADYWKEAGVEVVTYHDDVSTSQNENLNRIVDFHNSKSRDLDVSVHFNAYETTSKPMGTECLYVTQQSLASKVASAIAAAGDFPNRGPKKRTDLFFLNNTSEPAILIETCFVDSSADADNYGDNYNQICRAIAEAIYGQAIGEPPPEGERPPIEPPEPEQPPSESASQRPVLSKGSYGKDVVIVQNCLKALPIDGDFGSITENAVKDFQRFWHLDVDGIVGPDTWTKLEEEFDLPPYEPPEGALDPLDDTTLDRVIELALSSPVARYAWRDRGTSPEGYVQGMAVAWTTVVRRFYAGCPEVLEMSVGNTGDSDVDALAWYADVYDDQDMDNTHAGIDTLRHLFALLWGLGMRESSGQYCCGRDMSADNVTSDTAEAGLFQMSWNMETCSSSMSSLFDFYQSVRSTWQSALSWFKIDVTCSSSDWSCYGSGEGYAYQDLAKHCPQFAVETCLVGLRKRRQHWGPINRHEAELRYDVDILLGDIQELVMPSTV